MAIPLLFKLMRSGIKVPQDMSLVGFDDSTYAKQFNLTTVHQEVDFLGAEAGRLVFGSLSVDNSLKFRIGFGYISCIEGFNCSSVISLMEKS